MSNIVVTIAPDVVRTIVRNTVLAMPGVQAIADTDREKRNGVVVKLEANQCATVSLRVIGSAEVSLIELGRKIQRDVADVVQEVAGLCVTQVQVSFENVRK